MRLGLGYFASEKTEVYGAVGYDTSAVPKQTLESTYPDAFKVMFSLGLRHQVTQHVALGGSATYVQYLPVSTGHQGQGALAGASKVPNEDGDYRSRYLILQFRTRGLRFDDWEN